MLHNTEAITTRVLVFHLKRAQLLNWSAEMSGRKPAVCAAQELINAPICPNPPGSFSVELRDSSAFMLNDGLLTAPRIFNRPRRQETFANDCL